MRAAPRCSATYAAGAFRLTHATVLIFFQIIQLDFFCCALTQHNFIDIIHYRTSRGGWRLPPLSRINVCSESHRFVPFALKFSIQRGDGSEGQQKFKKFLVLNKRKNSDFFFSIQICIFHSVVHRFHFDVGLSCRINFEYLRTAVAPTRIHKVGGWTLIWHCQAARTNVTVGGEGPPQPCGRRQKDIKNGKNWQASPARTQRLLCCNNNTKLSYPKPSRVIDFPRFCCSNSKWT